MLTDVLEINKVPKFQVLFLRNDASQEVEVHEVKQVDFSTVQERLEKGESVFITSKNSQKIKPPKTKTKTHKSLKTKLVTAFYIDKT
jgi:hypothetical protein